MVDSRRVTVARALPLASSSRAKPSMSARRTAKQGQGPGLAPGGELAQIQHVRLASQAAVPGQEPGEDDPLGISEDRLDRGERSGWDGSAC
jgi:hypothetical protein